MPQSRYSLGVGNVLVTGGTGFVGRQVTKALIDAGHTVHLVSRAAASSDSHVKVRHTADLFSADSGELNTLLVGVDSVVHLAWHVDPSDYLNSDENWRCVFGSIRLAIAAKNIGIKHFVGIGTCVEYERTNSVRTPTTRVDPDTPYGAAKASLFFALREIFRESPTNFSWCRLFFLHGEGEHPDRLVPYIRSHIAGGTSPNLQTPSAVRDYLDVAEAGKRIAKVVSLQIPGVFNICSGRPISVGDLAIEITTGMGRLDLAKNIASKIFDIEPGPPDRIVGLPAPELEDCPKP